MTTLHRDNLKNEKVFTPHLREIFAAWQELQVRKNGPKRMKSESERESERQASTLFIYIIFFQFF